MGLCSKDSLRAQVACLNIIASYGKIEVADFGFKVVQKHYYV